LGLRRSAEDQRLGAIIEGVLCQGWAPITLADLESVAAGLEPFVRAGLVEVEALRLTLKPGALPYARTIAALFDPYRQDGVKRFSTAV
jgi:oxygen-independent coproporphyrinogen-3 oxidase